MAVPVRRHRGGGLQERPVRAPTPLSPLVEFDELLNQMSGLLESTVGATPAAAWTPLADVSKSEDAFHIEIGPGRGPRQPRRPARPWTPPLDRVVPKKHGKAVPDFSDTACDLRKRWSGRQDLNLRPLDPQE
ncbi:hypothetical protein [Streptomyces sp. NPDC126933]|uniref:hypothetical protein n=1 Tax=unclassified Streptomyces TaxID=2593676 RepID=UPI00364FCBED